jgi:hypothetical protein
MPINPRQEHAPGCDAPQGQCCSCGTEELWMDASSKLRALARTLRCPRDGGKVQLQQERNILTCDLGHTVPVSED